jgi:hypothetical protein
MKFQVVLQWPASSTNDFDRMTEIEDLLADKLSAENEVDGHDFGSQEMNIFVHTDDPQRTFKEIQNILSVHGFRVDARIAYRRVGGTEYSVLWPLDATACNVRQADYPSKCHLMTFGIGPTTRWIPSIIGSGSLEQNSKTNCINVVYLRVPSIS